MGKTETRSDIAPIRLRRLRTVGAGWPAAFLLCAVMTLLLQGCATAPAAQPAPVAATAGEKLYQSGNRWYLQGCYQEALRHYFGAYEYFSAGDRLAPAARTLNSMGNLYRRLGDPDTALSFYDEALEIDRQLADGQSEAQTLINRSAALLDSGQLDQAARDLDAAALRAGERPRLALALDRSVGILLTRRGELAAAEIRLNRAAADDSAPLEQAATQYALGKLRLAQGRPAAAQPHFEAALALDRRAGHTHGLADDLEALGDCLRQQERWAQAAFHYQRSARIFALMDHTDRTRQLLERLQAIKRAHPDRVDADLTLFFIDRWVDGEREADICP